MKLSLYEKLALDRESAHQAVLKMERREREFARLRHEHAGLQLDLATLKLQHALRRKYRSEQPRVPAGNSDGGQWTDEGGQSRIAPRLPASEDVRQERDRVRTIIAGGFEPDQLNLTVQDFSSRYCRGSIQREIPGQLKELTISDLMAAAQSGDIAARKCLKILKQDRFRK